MCVVDFSYNNWGRIRCLWGFIGWWRHIWQDVVAPSRLWFSFIFRHHLDILYLFLNFWQNARRDEWNFIQKQICVVDEMVLVPNLKIVFLFPAFETEPRLWILATPTDKSHSLSLENHSLISLVHNTNSPSFNALFWALILFCFPWIFN